MKKIVRILSIALIVCTLVSVMVLPAEAAATKVKITGSPTTVDTLNGVSAQYLPGTGNTNTGTYCCAGYVKKYYSTLYNISVSNLVTGGTPKSSNSNYCFKAITSGWRTGDIVYHRNSSGSGHWAIVKSVSGNNITLIEQNWKWKSGGATYAYKNRVVTYGSTSGLKVFRLYMNNQEKISSISSGAGGALTLKWTKVSSATGYRIQYDTDKSFGNPTTVWVKSPSTVSKTIKGLDKGTYYVRVRTYHEFAGNKYYGSWSAVSKVKISK